MIDRLLDRFVRTYEERERRKVEGWIHTAQENDKKFIVVGWDSFEMEEDAFYAENTEHAEKVKQSLVNKPGQNFVRIIEVPEAPKK